MIALTFDKICAAVAFSAVLGFLSGALYSIFEIIFSFVRKRLKDSDDQSRAPGSPVQLFDFVFFVILGVLFILVCYAFCDGVMSLYPPASLIGAFLIAKKILWKIVKTSVMLGKKHKKQ